MHAAVRPGADWHQAADSADWYEPHPRVRQSIASTDRAARAASMHGGCNACERMPVAIDPALRARRSEERRVGKSVDLVGRGIIIKNTERTAESWTAYDDSISTLRKIGVLRIES